MYGLLIMLATLTQLAQPQPAEKVREPVVVKVPDPYDAVAWAVEDALALRKSGGAHGCFYVWIGPEEKAEIAKINSLAVNSVLSHSETIVLPDLTAGGRLIRWDIKRLAPNPHDHLRLLGVLNYLAKGEPFWHADAKALGLLPAKVAPFVWIDGFSYTHTNAILTRETGHLYAMLQQETGLFCPLVRADYLLRKISMSVQGGVYYEARGFVVYDKGKRRKLNEKEILAKLGADAALSRKVRGDDRIGVAISGVTAQARAVEFIQGAVGPVRMSYDRSSDNENLIAHPLYSLLTVVDKADGKETIFTLPNRLLGYIATDGKGNLVDEVPAQIATDHRMPTPHPARLSAPHSCIRCHGPEGGVRTCRNDVPKLLSDPESLDAFDDLGDLRLTPAEAVDRLGGLYSGDFAIRTRDARNDYGDAVFKATRGMTAAQAAEEWSRQIETYWYSPVDAVTQLRDMGWSKPRSPQAVTGTLKRLQEKPEVDLLIDGQKATRLDPLIPAPRKGIPIRRQDQERTYAEQFRRAFPHRAPETNYGVAP
jgi:hypothetical protein